MMKTFFSKKKIKIQTEHVKSFHIVTVLTFVNLIFFFGNRCKSPVWESVQIVHQRANHLLQISSYRVNLCLQINYFVCKSGTSADENR